MKSFTFKGGIHPPEKKELAENNKIEVFPIPKEVVIPLSQHIGAPSKALVKKGEVVKKGQKIGEAQGFISANIHSSVCGKVKDITYINHPVSGRGMGVVITTDIESDDWDESIKPFGKVEDLTSEKIIEIVKEKGIVGMGGATFPTHVKLNPPPGKNYEILILNGAECEPFLTADYRLMLSESEKILLGIALIKKAAKVEKVYMAIENNKPEDIKVWKKICEKETWLELKVLKTKYPQGAEKQLIKALTKREVPSGGLPVDVQCLVHNVGTAYAIYEACYLGYPLIERITTITGAVAQRKNLKLRVGTNVKEIIEYCGGYLGNPKKLIFGGPMMGTSQKTDDIPVTKGTSGIVIQNEKEVKNFITTSCIRCGKCISICPMNLMPMEISARVENDYIDLAEQYGALDCIECGSCSYICPANRELVQIIRLGKKKIMLNKKRGK